MARVPAWIYLDPYVHLALKGHDALLYNPLNGETLEVEDQPAVIALLEALRGSESLFVTEWTEEPELQAFHDALTEKQMGGVLASRGRPVQLMPLYTVQPELDLDADDPERAFGHRVLRYLSELILYVNGSCSLDCAICERAFRQFPCCTRVYGDVELSAATVGMLVDQASKTSIRRIHLLGGNILEHSQRNELTRVLARAPMELQPTLHYRHLAAAAGDASDLLGLPTSVPRLVVSFPIVTTDLEAAVHHMGRTQRPWTTEIIVRSDHDIEQAEEIVSALGIDRFSVIPCFDGENLAFFEDQVFIDRQDILAARPQAPQIAANATINSVAFGKLTVVPDERIYSSVNASPLGTVGQRDALRVAAWAEICSRRSWRRTRETVEPCSCCRFALLCPPISEYGRVLGRENLCHVWGAPK